MSLDVLLLEKLARWRPDGRGALEVSAPEYGWAVTITADAADVVGCRLWELSLRRSGKPPLVADLRKHAEAVAARITGLLEPIRVIEVDEPRGVSLLRSTTPSRRGDVASYYEILLEIDGASSVRRYEVTHGEETRRQQVAYALTYESLAKLVSDLTI
jgi:hypothetical protein